MAVRLMTWNMQGGNAGKYSDIATQMAKYKVDVCCLQETGSLPSGYLLNEETRAISDVVLRIGNFQAGRRGIHTAVNFDNRLGGNNRCSLAIISEPAVLDIHVVPAPAGVKRPVIGIKIPGDLWIYSIHSPASIIAGRTGTIMLRDIPAAHDRWVCLGDFNCDPTVMAGFSTYGGLAMTHDSGGKLDYAIAQGVRLTHQAYLPALHSDHYSQIFDIQDGG